MGLTNANLKKRYFVSYVFFRCCTDNFPATCLQNRVELLHPLTGPWCLAWHLILSRMHGRPGDLSDFIFRLLLTMFSPPRRRWPGFFLCHNTTHAALSLLNCVQQVCPSIMHGQVMLLQVDVSTQQYHLPLVVTIIYGALKTIWDLRNKSSKHVIPHQV